MRINPIIHIIILFLFVTGCSNATNADSRKISSADKENMQYINPLMLHNTAKNNDAAGVLELLDQGIDINAMDEYNRTALMYASYEGYIEIMGSLIPNGADLDIRDINGRTALMFAASGPFPEAVRMLLENGAEIDVRDSDEQYTALMYAAAEGHLENVKLLIEYGADPVLKDIDGDDALVFARNYGHPDVAEYLELQVKSVKE